MMSRDEIELAIFDALDPATPAGSWRQQTVELAWQLDQMGALTQNDIEQMRQSRDRMQQEIDRFVGQQGHG
ncbi:hypothetical protein [Spirosoma jeollabukense]